MTKYMIMALSLFLFFQSSSIADTQSPDSEIESQQEPMSQFLFSNDGGRSFQEIELPFHIVDILMSPNKSGEILGVTDEGELISSLNDGKTWKVIKTLGIRCADWNRCKLFATPTGTIFIYGGYGGKHFIRVGDKKIAGSKFDWVNSMHVTSFGDILIVAGANGAYNHVLISKDDGVTWKRYFDNDLSSGIFVSPQGTIFIGRTELTPKNFAISSPYIRLSNDTPKSHELPFSSLRSLPSGKIWAYGERAQEQGNGYISKDDGLTWEPLVLPDEIAMLLASNRTDTLIITERDGKILKYLSKSKPTPDDDFILACSFTGPCFRSNHDLPLDAEMEWEKSFKVKFKVTKGVRSVLEKDAYGTYFILNPMGFYRSNDNGKSWEKPISSYLPVESGDIKIVTDPKQPGKVYLNWVEWPDI